MCSACVFAYVRASVRTVWGAWLRRHCRRDVLHFRRAVALGGGRQLGCPLCVLLMSLVAQVLPENFWRTRAHTHTHARTELRAADMRQAPRYCARIHIFAKPSDTRRRRRRRSRLSRRRRRNSWAVDLTLPIVCSFVFEHTQLLASRCVVGAHAGALCASYFDTLVRLNWIQCTYTHKLDAGDIVCVRESFAGSAACRRLCGLIYCYVCACGGLRTD